MEENRLERIRAKLVIFDLDGTLIDSRSDIGWAANKTLLEMGYEEKGVEEIRKAIGWGVRMLLKGLIPGADEDELEEGRKIFLRHYCSHLVVDTTLYDGVVDVLEDLKVRSKLLAIVTNKPLAPTMLLLEAFKIDGYFQIVLGGDSLKNKKPHPEPIIHICGALGVDPSDTVMVGDSPTDVVAGKGGGAVTVGCVYGYRGEEELKESGCDRLIGSLGELGGIID